MTELVLRFLIGGTLVSLFSLLGECFRPKSFGGLFSAAPSIALATLLLTLHQQGRLYAALEARSMVLGSFAFLAYASAVSWVLHHRRPPTLRTAILLLPVWLGVSLGLLFLLPHHEAH